MADTVAVMNAGRIEQLGPPAELYDLPASAFVASFLGQANLLAAMATGRAGTDTTVVVRGGRFTVPTDRARAASGPTYLGIRPEKLHLATPADPVPPEHQRLTGVVTDASRLGVATRYLVRTAWGTELSAFAADTGAAPTVQPGAEVVAHWHPRHAFLLDREGDAEDHAGPTAAGGPAEVGRVDARGAQPPEVPA